LFFMKKTSFSVLQVQNSRFSYSYGRSLGDKLNINKSQRHPSIQKR